MIEHGRPRGARRAPAPPSALFGELVRDRLLVQLARRFDVPVTLVVAGAGFGKTTLLAQAIRSNQAAPRGLDAWIACEPGDEDAARLSQAIVASLGSAGVERDPVERVLDALRAVSPIDVCLLVDDLHELPSGSTGEQLLTSVIQRLPPHAHVVLASREPARVPLARRRAAGQVVDIDVYALALTPTEAGSLAVLHGHDPASVSGLAGWPSLVRLTLSAPQGATPQFLREEIVAALTPDEETALLALATLGWGSPLDVEQVAGHPVDLDRLAGKVPLLRRDADGWFGVHHLWEDAVERLFPAAEVAELRGRALALLQRRGETIRTGTFALRWNDIAAFRIAAVLLVRDTFGALPIEIARRWLEAAPVTARTTPELELLALSIRHASSFDHGELDGEIDGLAARFDELGDADAQGVTLAFGTVVAFARGDEARLFHLAQRVDALEAATQEPILRFLSGAVTAALAALLGDVDGSLAAIEALSLVDVPRSITELVTRLHVAMLVLAGRADEAQRYAERLADSPGIYVRSIPALVRWLSGDPSDFVGGTAPIDPGPETNERDRFYHAAYLTPICASLGDRDSIEALRPVVQKVAAAGPDARDSAIAALAAAYRHVLDHDDRSAAGAIADHLARVPLSDALGEVHLRRTLAIAYVTNEEVRRRWDDADLGPSHQRARAVARMLVDARAHAMAADVTLPDPGLVFTCLPLPWSVELICRAQAAGCAGAVELCRRLAAWTPTALDDELRWLADHHDSDVRRGAMALAGELPDRDRPHLRIEVLGPLRIRAGDDPRDGPELRRGRVRTLLELLVLAGPLRRERVMDLMWPELSPHAAAQNLRVTLTRLRQLLEPDRRPGHPTSALHADGESIAIAGPPGVMVDIWEFDDLVAAARRAQQAGSSGETLACLERACARWRGEPYADLIGIDELAGEIERVERSVVDVTLDLGERYLVAGRFDDAAVSAERARRASPYSERAHRLNIAVQLQRRDHAAVGRAVDDVETMLAELGVTAEPATQMLVRQARARTTDA